MFKTNFVIMVY